MSDICWKTECTLLTDTEVLDCCIDLSEKLHDEIFALMPDFYDNTPTKYCKEIEENREYLKERQELIWNLLNT
jgi:hypothetical protein